MFLKSIVFRRPIICKLWESAIMQLSIKSTIKAHKSQALNDSMRKVTEVVVTSA